MPIESTFRSKLFVPGARADLFDKALASACDAVSFDLEDSVLPEAKARARSQVAAAIAAAARRPAAPQLIVRVNGLDTPWFEDDLRAVVVPGLSWINLPKMESPADVRHAALRIQAAEAVAGVDVPVRLLVNIETPGGLQRAAEIAAADPRVAGLQLGLGDLFEPLGIARDDPANVHAAMFTMRLAAGAAGVRAYDGAYPHLSDAGGLRAEAQLSRRLGYTGKSCIHPSQVAVCNEVFGVEADELAWAERVLAAERKAGGRGAFAVDGRMIDAPFLQRARELVRASSNARREPPR